MQLVHHQRYAHSLINRLSASFLAFFKPVSPIFFQPPLGVIFRLLRHCGWHNLLIHLAASYVMRQPRGGRCAAPLISHHCGVLRFRLLSSGSGHYSPALRRLTLMFLCFKTLTASLPPCDVLPVNRLFHIALRLPSRLRGVLLLRLLLAPLLHLPSRLRGVLQLDEQLAQMGVLPTAFAASYGRKSAF